MKYHSNLFQQLESTQLVDLGQKGGLEPSIVSVNMWDPYQCFKKDRINRASKLSDVWWWGKE